MGGHFWTEHGLHTPRMPPEVHAEILYQVEEKLKTLFCRVDHAVVAPEKADHGDLDVLVLAKTVTDTIPPIEKLANLLEAEKYQHANGLLCFAIPWPKSMIDDSGEHKEPFAQLDLRICESAAEFNWRMLIQAHGDLINIVSAIVRHKGLTITDQALFVRISDIETSNRKLSRVELTRDPHRALAYLGLNADRFFTPFSTKEEMMNFITTCRFHDPGYAKKTAAQDMRSTQDSPVEALHKWNQSVYKARPMFRYWFEEYLPKHTDDKPGRSAHWSREQTLQDVFSYFGPLVETHYYQQLKYGRTQAGRVTFTQDLKFKLSTKYPNLSIEDLNDTVKAVKKKMTTAQPDGGVTEFARVCNAWADGEFGFVIEWAVENYVEILQAYRAMVAQALADRKLDSSKVAPFSTTPVETYTAADDKLIVELKTKGKMWPEILRAIKKTSRSQLIAHYKQDLAAPKPAA